MIVFPSEILDGLFSKWFWTCEIEKEKLVLGQGSLCYKALRKFGSDRVWVLQLLGQLQIMHFLLLT